MAKYSKQQLKQKALRVLEEKQKDSILYMRFVIELASNQGVTARHVENKIVEYANHGNS